MESTKDYKRVYVWQLPVRIFHWLNALSVIVLATTGFLIADPPAFLSQKEAYNSYLVGYIRVIHFTSAYVFVGVMILRIYWAFVGNRYAHWRAFWPFTKKGIHNIIHVLKHDLFLLPEKNPKLSNISIGHNYMATIAYFLMFILALIMVFTGFGLYADNSTWFFPKLFKWVPSVLGGDFFTRQIHHICMWFIIFIIIIHVYLVLYHDWLESRGETSSMFSGFKFVRKERVVKEEEITKETITARFEDEFEDDIEIEKKD